MSREQVATVEQESQQLVSVLKLAALERGLRWAVLFTVAVLPLSEAAKNIGFAVSLALYLAVLLLQDWKWPGVPLVGLGLLGLLGGTFLSALASEYPFHAARGVWEVFRHVSFFFIVLRAFRLDADIGWVVAAAAVGTGTAAVIFLYQYFLVGMPLFRFLSIGGENGSAQFLVMVLLLLLSVLAVVQIDVRSRWALAATVLILLLLLGVTQARTMWLAFVLMGVSLSLWLRHWGIAAGVAGLVLTIAMVVTFRDKPLGEQVRGLLLPGRGLSARIDLWEKSLRIWRDHPWFGVGPRAFKTEEDVAKDPVRGRYGVAGSYGQAHNLWVHTAAEMGIVGLLGLLGWVATVLRFLWGLRGIRGDPWAGALWVGTAGAFGAMMIAGITEPAIGYEHSLFLNAELALLAGVAGPRTGRDDRQAQGSRMEEIRR